MMYWIIGTISLFALIFYLYFGHYAMGLFYQCMKHDVKISYWELAMMKRRGVPINDYLRTAIKLKEKDIDVKIKDLELHAKSGGRIANVVDLLLKAKRNKIELTYHQAAIMDLDEIKHKKPEDKNEANEKVPENKEETNSQQIEPEQTNSNEETSAEPEKINND
jgi:uncharacterized protein YqfA (UPF0365 family)